MLGRPPSILVAALVLGALVPAALPVSAAGCSDTSVTQYIAVGSPLSEQVSASELLLLFVMGKTPTTAQQGHLVNGVDAYVVDLHCEAVGGQYSLTGNDNGLAQYNLAISFWSAAPDWQETHGIGTARDVSGDVPDGARYAVVILESGVPAAGLKPGLPPTPYSVRFQFEMTI